MKNSLKQLFRTPVKTGLFCVIFLFGTALFTVGLNLWLEISEKIKAADETFVTIGMAGQKEQSTFMERRWDAGLKGYVYQEKAAYGAYLTPDILEGLDVGYISKPRQRPYFGAVSPGNLTGGELTDESVTAVSLAEIRAPGDCVPEGPVPVEVVRVLWGTRSLESGLPLCDSCLPHKRYAVTYIGNPSLLSFGGRSIPPRKDWRSKPPMALRFPYRRYITISPV